jgi:hypothetical protein
MMENDGPVETAKRLVLDFKYHDGLRKLWELKRLDLTVEAIIMREPWCELFSDEILNRAKERLRELDYIV